MITQHERTKSPLLTIEKNIESQGMHRNPGDISWLINFLNRIEMAKDQVNDNSRSVISDAIKASMRKLKLSADCRKVINGEISSLNINRRDFFAMCQTYREELAALELKTEIQQFIHDSLNAELRDNVFYKTHSYLLTSPPNEKKIRKLDDFIRLLNIKPPIKLDPCYTPNSAHGKKMEAQYKLSLDLITAKYKSGELKPVFFENEDRIHRFNGEFADLIHELQRKNPSDLARERFEYEAALERQRHTSPFAANIYEELTGQAVDHTRRPG